MSRAFELSKLSAVLYAIARELADHNDQHALQRGAWLVDLAVQLVDDIKQPPENTPPALAGGDNRLHALLRNVGRELAALNDPRALQRAALLVDVAQQLVDDLTLQAEQAEAGA